MIHTYVNMYIAFVTPVMDVRDREHGCRKWHFGQAQDLENWAAHLHQEFVGVFILKLTCCALKQSFDLIFPYLEPISTVFTNVVCSPHFIPMRKTRVMRMIRITKMTLMNRVTV